MTAIKLHCGSPTRPLTPEEVDVLASHLAWHAHVYLQEVHGYRGTIVVESDPLDIPEGRDGTDDSREREYFAALPEHGRDYWRAVARSVHLEICQTFGDEIEEIEE